MDEIWSRLYLLCLSSIAFWRTWSYFFILELLSYYSYSIGQVQNPSKWSGWPGLHGRPFAPRANALLLRYSPKKMMRFGSFTPGFVPGVSPSPGLIGSPPAYAHSAIGSPILGGAAAVDSARGLAPLVDTLAPKLVATEGVEPPVSLPNGRVF